MTATEIQHPIVFSSISFGIRETKADKNSPNLARHESVAEMQNISNQKIRTQKETLSCRPGGRSRNSSSNAFGASKTVEAREWWERNATSKAQSVRARVYNIFQTQAKISNTSTNAKIREHDKRQKNRATKSKLVESRGKDQHHNRINPSNYIHINQSTSLRSVRIMLSLAVPRD